MPRHILENVPDYDHYVIEDFTTTTAYYGAIGYKGENIGTQGVQELFFFCELKGFGDSRIKSMTCKRFIKQTTVI